MRSALLTSTFAAAVKALGEGPCIEWPGSRKPTGYATWHRKGQPERLTRAVWEATDGPAPESQEVRHTCDNPPCIRRGHLVLGSHAQNMADMVQRGREARGERNGRSTLFDDDVDEIRRLKAEGWSHRQVAARFGINRATVSGIHTGRVRRLPT